MGIDLALKLGKAPLLQFSLHLSRLYLFFQQMLFHLGLLFQRMDGAAYLCLHQVKGLGGAAQLVITANDQRGCVIPPVADHIRRPPQRRQRPENTAVEHQQHHAHQCGGNY